MSERDVGAALGQLYREWGDRLRVLVDRSRPMAERIDALRWIDTTTGEGFVEYTPEQVELATNELLADGAGRDQEAE